MKQTPIERLLHWAVDDVRLAGGLYRIRNETGAPARTGTPASPTTVKGSMDMPSVPKSARHLAVNDVIVRHPFHPDRTVEWAVTANLGVGGDGMVRIEHDDPDGSEGLLAVEATTKVDVRVTPREVMVTGLRDLAAYLEDHPELPVNRDQAIAYSASNGRDVRDAVAEVDRVAALLGVPAGRRSGMPAAHAAAVKFGPVTYLAYASDVYPEQVA